MASEMDLEAIYGNLSQARLETAAAILRQNPNCSSSAGIESVIARCNIAMLIWSAAIDIGSSLMIQEEQRTSVGRSSEITAFITKDMDKKHPDLGLRLQWRGFLHLHNIQHRADHQMTRFADSCRSCYRAFVSINSLLIPANRLALDSFRWMESLR